ncbi:MAG: PDZ domain-containing protein [Cyanobacteria bacterium HKST-UBA02]|nr:PDZ domain-containing protein [Cyanobacteria bacterium HKST-UBA02]
MNRSLQIPLALLVLLFESLPALAQADDLTRQRDELTREVLSVPDDEQDSEKLLGVTAKQERIVEIERKLLDLDEQKLAAEKKTFQTGKHPADLPASPSGDPLAWKLSVFHGLKPVSTRAWLGRKLDLKEQALEARSRALAFKSQEIQANKHFLDVKLADEKSGNKRADLRRDLLKELFVAKSQCSEASQRATRLSAQSFACDRNSREQLEAIARRILELDRVKKEGGEIFASKSYLLSRRGQALGPRQFSTGIIVDDTRDRIVRVHETLPGSPARESGINPGDELLIVRGLPVVGLAFDEVDKLLTGKEGEDIEVTLLSADGLKDLTLVTNSRAEKKTHPQLKEMLDKARSGDDYAGAAETLLDMADYALTYSAGNSVVEDYLKEAIDLAVAHKAEAGHMLPRAYCDAASFYLKQFGTLSRQYVSPDLPEGITPQLPPVTADEWLARATACQESLLGLDGQSYGGDPEAGRRLAVLADSFYKQFAFRRIKTCEPAIGLYEKAIAVEKVRGGEHLLLAAAHRRNLGLVFTDQELFEKASPFWSDCVEAYCSILPAESSEIYGSRQMQFETRMRLGKYEEARKTLIEQLGVADLVFTADSGIDETTVNSSLRRVILPLAVCEDKLGNAARCQELSERLIPLCQDEDRKGELAEALLLAGRSAFASGKPVDAVEHLTAAMQILSGAEKSACINELARVYVGTDRAAEAKVLCLTQVEGYEARLESGDGKQIVYAGPACRTADILSDLGEYESARHLYQLAIAAYRQGLIDTITGDRQKGEISQNARELADCLDNSMAALASNLKKSGKNQWASRVEKGQKALSSKKAGLEELDLEWLKKLSTEDVI